MQRQLERQSRGLTAQEYYDINGKKPKSYMMFYIFVIFCLIFYILWAVFYGFV